MFLLFLAIVAFACMGRGLARRRPARAWGYRGWDSWSEPHQHEAPAAAEERFEAWHQKVHAGEDREAQEGDYRA